MYRRNRSLNVKITNSLATCGVIDYTAYTMGRLGLASGETIATLTWYTCATPDGTFLPAYDEYNAAVTSTVSTVGTGKSVSIPSALADACYLKAVGDVSLTDMATLELKS
jgi:hypothetical protein